MTARPASPSSSGNWSKTTENVNSQQTFHISRANFLDPFPILLVPYRQPGSRQRVQSAIDCVKRGKTSRSYTVSYSYWNNPKFCHTFRVPIFVQLLAYHTLGEFRGFLPPIFLLDMLHSTGIPSTSIASEQTDLHRAS